MQRFKTEEMSSSSSISSSGSTAGGPSSSGSVNWSAYSCSQNLPAILNDPTIGKQKDFFTRTWGESFVDTINVGPSPLLEDVPNAYFVTYFRKLLKRYRKLQERKSSASTALSPNQSSLQQLFPQLSLKEASQLIKSEASPIPTIFFSQNFSLSNSESFREVFGIDGNQMPSKSIQDKLSHHLDLVEVGLAQQISKKSSAFFSAVSTQDRVAEKVSKAIVLVRQIKQELVDVKREHVIEPLSVVKLARKKSNLEQLYQKLQLMATVHQAQRAIQSLLGNSDYVGALDLITTTQEVLKQELQGLISFRHLDSQLVEIRNAIEKMLRAELERNLSADLNRPVEQMTTFCDKDKLTSIVFGHLRMGKVAAIITVVAKEISTAMTTTCKQTLIEAVSESDSKSDSLIGSNSIHMTIPSLSTDLWIKMISHLGQRLVLLLQHIKEVILLFQNCANVAAGQSSENSVAGAYIQEPEDPLISSELFTTFSSELSMQLEKTTETADEKFSGMLRNRKTWNNRLEVLTTLKVVKEYISSLEEFAHTLPSGSTKSFRYSSAIEMKAQVTEYIKDFHQKKVEVVNIALDREKWRLANEERVKQHWPVTDIRVLIEQKATKEFDDSPPNMPRCASVASNESFETSDIAKDAKTNGNGTTNNSDSENSDTIRTAEVFFVILDALADYCHLLNLTSTAEVLLSLVELLRVANARIAHLVLGAGAVELKVCKSITVVNLVLVYRGVCLISDSLLQVRDVFERSIQSTKSQHILKQVDTVHLELCRHGESIENKMVSIIGEIIENELANWEARPPVPSTPINNVSRHIVKFRDAIGTVLTQTKISSLFLRVDKIFRTRLKQRIAALGIAKDGGPRHGVVTSEMMHYAENIRKLSVLPPNVISNSCLTNELWE
ncbi:unnamed protein product [Orchesella dallaii]|uniref:Vacuolar protein sorting-associated protein 54 n=1 Tax=Orchesella dallaii TaxID=48710 RepID=A0ABP1S5G1_9HEXA